MSKPISYTILEPTTPGALGEYQQVRVETPLGSVAIVRVPGGVWLHASRELPYYDPPGALRCVLDMEPRLPESKNPPELGDRKLLHAGLFVPDNAPAGPLFDNSEEG